MNINTLKTYAHTLHQLSGKVEAEELTSSKAWYLYRCKLVDFLFEFKEHFVQREVKQILSDLGYYPVSFWAKKLDVSRALMYRDVLPFGHVVEFEKGLKYVTFEIGFTYTKRKSGWAKVKQDFPKRPVGRPKKQTTPVS
jgi:hypothetical protein